MTDSTTDRRTALKLIGGGVAAAPLMAQAATQAQFDCGVARTGRRGAGLY